MNLKMAKKTAKALMKKKINNYLVIDRWIFEPEIRELKLLANLNNSTQRIYPEVFDQKTDPKVREAEKNFESHPTTHCLMIIQKVSFSSRDIFGCFFKHSTSISAEPKVRSITTTNPSPMISSYVPLIYMYSFSPVRLELLEFYCYSMV